MRPDWVDQAHRDPGLGRLRPRANPRVHGPTISSYDQPEPWTAEDMADVDRDADEIDQRAIAMEWAVTHPRDPGPNPYDPKPKSRAVKLDELAALVIAFLAASFIFAHLLVAAGVGLANCQ